MWRGWAIVVLLAVAVTVPASAQRRGGGGLSSRPVMSFRAATTVRGPAFVGHINRTYPRSHVGVTFHTGFYPHYCRHHHFPYCPWGYGFCNGYGGYAGYGYTAYAYPYYGYGYPSYWGTSSYEASDNSSQQDLLQQNTELQSQISQLSQQVTELREQQEALLRPPAPASPPAPATPAAPDSAANSVATEPTTLIYKDGHSEQVSNYAITGKTLWIFNEQRARKVPLSSIDTEQTRHANEDRGIDFAVPDQR